MIFEGKVGMVCGNKNMPYWVKEADLGQGLERYSFRVEETSEKKIQILSTQVPLEF